METAAPEAKSNLSSLLRRAKTGESVDLAHGHNGPRFRIDTGLDQLKRSLEADPCWKGKVAYRNEAIWESEWREES